jgi:protein arginine kinase activator
MGNPLKCDLCGEPATVHLTQIVKSKIHKVDLCEACAKAKGVTDPAGFSLSDILVKETLEASESDPGLKCPECGMTQQDFKKHGRFGCPSCYETFDGMLKPMLGNMHKGIVHIGKMPKKVLARRSVYDRLTELETELTMAIKSERYEDAARYRDEIRQFQESIGKKRED